MSLPLPELLVALATMLAALIVLTRRDCSPLQVVSLAGALIACLVGASRTTAQSLRGGTLTFTSFGVMLGLGVLVGGWATQSTCRRHGLSTALSARCYTYSVAAALVCAQAAPLIEHFDFGETSTTSTIGQWAALPGLFGASIAAMLVFGRHQKRARKWLDLASPGAVTSLVLFHLGTYLFGSHFGIALDSKSTWLTPLGRFPRWEPPLPEGAPAWLAQVQFQQLATDSLWASPVHPVQLYAAGWALLLAWAVRFAVRRQQFAGQTFLTLALSYTGGLGLLELWTANPMLPLPRTVRQLLGALLITVLILLWRQWGTRAFASTPNLT